MLNLPLVIAPFPVGFIFRAVHCNNYHFLWAWDSDISVQYCFCIPICQMIYKCQVFLVPTSSLLLNPRLPEYILSLVSKFTQSHFSREYEKVFNPKMFSCSCFKLYFPKIVASLKCSQWQQFFFKFYRYYFNRKI